MASIGSLPFIVKTKAESYVLLFGKNQHRPRLPFFSNEPKKSPNFSVFREGLSLRFNPVRATGGEGVSGVESEDAFQATIEKSKKVLAVQRDLLQQVILGPLLLIVMIDVEIPVQILL